MSYNKTIWKPGDIITADKWNNLTNNIPSLKIIQIPLELIENEGTTIGKLLVTSEQLNNYIQNGYLCYYIKDNIFYYYFYKTELYWSFRNINTVNIKWYDKGNGYLETILSTPAEEKPSGPIK